MVRIGITSSAQSWPSEPAGQQRLTNYRLVLENAGAEGEFLLLDKNTPEDAARLASQLDGLLLSGGADLAPELYGQTPLPDANLDIINPARPALEFALVDEFAQRGKPILGICYGCQLLNVWAGGALLQDIALQWPHAIAHRAAPEAPHIEARHQITIRSGSALARIAETHKADVNSYHHQGISQVAPSNKITAQAVANSSDGIIEAIEFGPLQKGEWVLGVQWHPERDREHPITQRIFDSFVRATL